MSFVVTIPEALAAVATDLAGIGSTIGTANAAPRSRPRRCVGVGAGHLVLAVERRRDPRPGSDAIAAAATAETPNCTMRFIAFS